MSSENKKRGIASVIDDEEFKAKLTAALASRKPTAYDEARSFATAYLKDISASIHATGSLKSMGAILKDYAIAFRPDTFRKAVLDVLSEARDTKTKNILAKDSYGVNVKKEKKTDGTEKAESSAADSALTNALRKADEERDEARRERDEARHELAKAEEKIEKLTKHVEVLKRHVQQPMKQQVESTPQES